MGALLDRGRAQFWVLAVFIPLLLFQDSVRHLAFARGRPQTAAASDGLWLGLQAAGLILTILLGHASALNVFGIWAAAGSVAGLYGGLRLRVYPTLSGCAEWLRDNAALCKRLLLEFVVSSGSYYALLYGLALIAGVGELGRLRAAQTLIGPVIVVLLGGNSLGIPESVRIRADVRRLKRFALLLSCLLIAASVIWGVLVVMFLPLFGPRVFPDTWDFARPLVPIMTVFASSIGASTGPISALRALGENSWILRARGASGAVALAVGLTLAAFVGAQGVVGALAASEWLLAGGAAAWLRKPKRGSDNAVKALETYVPT
jgi:O-antigen/teichoic acid export membrane protein